MTFEFEQKRLSEVYKLVEIGLKEISDSIVYSNSEIKRNNREMWESVPNLSSANDTNNLVAAKAYLDVLAQNNRALEFKKKRYDVLLKMLKSAYFGKIDFKEKESKENNQIYIGLGSLSDEKTGELVIFDWRAPICSMFYDSDIGQVEYVSPSGTIHGEMSKRFQFKIEFDKLIHMIDSAIKIDDDILIQILSQNTDNKMKTIVTTIQREQNKIIRDDQNDVMIAIGPAGSGKTSVALHRIAYILYRERANLTYKDILILTPNSIFSEYISTVLPQLGEENVKETTVIQIVADLHSGYSLQSYMDYMESTLLGNDSKRLRNIKTKTSYGFLMKLDMQIDEYRLKLFDFSDIVYGGKIIVSSEDLSKMYTNELSRFSPQQRMERIKSRLESILKKFRLSEYEAQYKHIFDANEYLSTFEAKKLAKMNVDRIFTEIDSKVSSIGQIDWSCYYLLFIKSKFPKIYGITKNQFDKKYLLYEDIIPYSYFLEAMGITAKTDNVKHVIIDEQQDYPYITIKFLSKLFKQAKFTMLGDQNQSISKGTDIYDPIGHIEMFSERKVSIVKLSKSYRSSFEIYEFCNSILTEDIYDSSVVIRHEDSPKVIRLRDEKYDHILELAEEAIKDGYKTVAIITKTVKTAAMIFENIYTSKAHINLIDSEESELKKDINILPSYFAKGLEFDCVIIPDADKTNYYDEGDRKILYTVCSRALHRLIVCYGEDKSELF